MSDDEKDLIEELGRDGDEAGDSRALVERAYRELHAVAQRLLASERADHTLQPTALVHEAWLRLEDGGRFNDANHFFATAARAMRRVLVDHARGKGRAKRGGGWQRVELEPASDEGESEEVDLVALDAALQQLEAASPRQARVVELRFFAGLEMDAIATVLDVSPATVARDWRFARAWMARALDGA